MYGVILKEDLKLEIALIGSRIMEIISKKENPIEALRLLCSIYHTTKSINPSATYDEIAESNHCLLSDIQEAKDLNNSLSFDFRISK